MKSLKVVIVVAVLAITGAVFSSFKPAAANYAASEGILGAGSSFAYPIYSKMFSEYYKMTGIKVNYQSIGSGGGIKQLMNKIIDFGASDAFLSEQQMKEAPAPVIHIPTCMGAAVITYNLPGNPVLKFTGDVVADIYLGKIKNWNDARIKKLNPGVNIPALPISVVHRSDGSGTTFMFTDYLSKVSAAWKSKIGRSTAVDWPVGLGAKGSEGVSGMIRQIPGGIGYVELIYALQNKMPVGLLRNKSGHYIPASIKSVTASANVQIPASARVSITDTPAPDGYPISSFTWVLLYKDQNVSHHSEAKAKEIVKLVWWMTHDGQKYTQPLLYAPLPKAAVKVVEANLKSITYKGKRIL